LSRRRRYAYRPIKSFVDRRSLHLVAHLVADCCIRYSLDKKRTDERMRVGEERLVTGEESMKKQEKAVKRDHVKLHLCGLQIRLDGVGLVLHPMRHRIA